MHLRKKFYQVEFFFNLLVIVGFLLICLKLHYIKNIQYVIPSYQEIIEWHYKAIILIVAAWVLLLSNFNYYSLKNIKLFKQLNVLSKVFGLFTLLVFTISGLKSEDLLSVNLTIFYLVSVYVVIILLKIISFYFLKKLFNTGKYSANALIIGNNQNVNKLKETIHNRKDLGIKVFKILDPNKLLLADFNTLISQQNINIIYIALQDFNDNGYYKEIYEKAIENHILIYYIPYAFEEKALSYSVSYIDTLPVYSVKKFPLDYAYNQLIKSLFDFWVSFFVCVFLLSWLFPIIALLIKFDSKGPVIFKQKRRGLNGNEFDCYKFRTMRNDGTNSIKATVVNDNRITKIGNFLRKTSVDELPQFLNVLKGDMSIVGPRPHMISQDVYYSEIIKKYNLRNYVKPGITGLAQIKGYRGAIDSDKDMEDRIRTDIFYVSNWSMLLDIQIIYQTVVLVFKGDENAI